MPLTLEGLCLTKTDYHSASYWRLLVTLVACTRHQTSLLKEKLRHKWSIIRKTITHLRSYTFAGHFLFLYYSCSEVCIKTKVKTEHPNMFARWKVKGLPLKSIEPRARKTKNNSHHCKWRVRIIRHVDVHSTHRNYARGQEVHQSPSGETRNTLQFVKQEN